MHVQFLCVVSAKSSEIPGGHEHFIVNNSYQSEHRDTIGTIVILASRRVLGQDRIRDLDIELDLSYF